MIIIVHHPGGGEIRRVLASSSIGYDRGDKWRRSHIDEHYYPIPDGNTVRRGKFCSSGYPQFTIPDRGNIVSTKSFEGNKPCNATTPIGQAIGCPFVGHKPNCMSSCRLVNSTICDVIYVGHNKLGSEMHWLPPTYLQRWWHQHWSRNNSHSRHFNRINGGFHSLLPNREESPKWCPKYNMSRPLYIYSNNTSRTRDTENPILMECSKLAAHDADIKTQQFWNLLGYEHNNYSPIYASLPLHRVVMIREPFSWLRSKFYWHKKHKDHKCDDTAWTESYALGYIFTLCGEDCANRFKMKTMTLQEMFIQAQDNLRNSFSVVGLLNETDAFYDMIDKRIYYIDIKVNVSLGGRHASTKHGETVEEYIRCSGLFNNVTFHQRLINEVPAVAAIDKLYQVGVKVNQFQKKELNQCSEDA